MDTATACAAAKALRRSSRPRPRSKKHAQARNSAARPPRSGCSQPALFFKARDPGRTRALCFLEGIRQWRSTAVYKSVESIGTTDRLSTQTGARAKLLHASPAFCPRRHTGFGVTQVGASIGKTGLVHSKGAALLLLLFIDIPIKEQPELPETVPTHPTKGPSRDLAWPSPGQASLATDTRHGLSHRRGKPARGRCERIVMGRTAPRRRDTQRIKTLSN